MAFLLGYLFRMFLYQIGLQDRNLASLQDIGHICFLAKTIKVKTESTAHW
jgi:hypothetical protein